MSLKTLPHVLMLAGMLYVFFIKSERNSENQGANEIGDIVHDKFGSPNQGDSGERQRSLFTKKPNVLPAKLPVEEKLDESLKGLAKITDPIEMAELDMARRLPRYEKLFAEWKLHDTDKEVAILIIKDREVGLAGLRVEGFKYGFGGAWKVMPKMKEVAVKANKLLEGLLGPEKAAEIFAIDETFWKIPG